MARAVGFLAAGLMKLGMLMVLVGFFALEWAYTTGKRNRAKG